MVLHPAPRGPTLPPDITVVKVHESNLDEHLEMRVASGLSRAAAERLFSRSLAMDSNVRLFTARLNGRAVGGSMALCSRQARGIYAVGTLPATRVEEWAPLYLGCSRGRSRLRTRHGPCFQS
jgi:hypothetical protein